VVAGGAEPSPALRCGSMQILWGFGIRLGWEGGVPCFGHLGCCDIVKIIAVKMLPELQVTCLLGHLNLKS